MFPSVSRTNAPRTHRRHVRSAAFLLTLVLPGCADQDPPTLAAPKPSVSGAPEVLAERFRTLDEEFSYLARERVPGGFGGWYFDADGTVHVYLTDLDRADAAKAVIVPLLKARNVRQRGRGLDLENVIFHQGQFDFATLRAWRARINDAASEIPGIVSTDVQEALNRVVIGVETAEGVEAVRAVIARLGIPEAAVVAKLEERPRPAKTLSDYTRPVIGGFAVAYYDDFDAMQWRCTFGFNAYRGLTPGFVTASHCSDTMGKLDNEEFYQPVIHSNYSIAFETVDPHFGSPGTLCPADFTCRWSDALFATYHPGSDLSGYGRIARTETFGNYEGSTLVISELSIVTELSYPDYGMLLDKMGFETGWTYGSVTETCDDQFLAYNRVLLCQDQINTGIDFGDSGAPVFYIVGASAVALAGVLWGGNPGEAYMSSMSNVELDLGALDTHP